jgi:hypothetical protein
MQYLPSIAAFPKKRMRFVAAYSFPLSTASHFMKPICHLHKRTFPGTKVHTHLSRISQAVAGQPEPCKPFLEIACPQSRQGNVTSPSLMLANEACSGKTIYAYNSVTAINSKVELPLVPGCNNHRQRNNRLTILMETLETLVPSTNPNANLYHCGGL